MAPFIKKWLSQPKVKSNLKILLFCTILVLLWRVGLEILNSVVIPEFHIATQATGLMRWASWDGGWYRGLIENGYYYQPGQQGSVAFFPGFPAITYIASFMGHINPLVVGLLLNTLLTVGTCYFLYKTTLNLAKRLHVPQYSPALTVILFLIFPSSFFLASFYAESLLIFSLTAAIYFALTDRLIPAAIFAAIAAACKSLGLVGLPIILLIDYSMHAKRLLDMNYIRSKVKIYCGITAISLSLFICYLIFLQLSYHDALAFIHVLAAWGRGGSGSALQKLWYAYYAHTFDYAYFGGMYNYVVSILEMYLPLLFLVLSVYLTLRYKTYWLLFMCAFMLYLPLSTGNINSMNRYVYGMTPIFVLASIFISRINVALRFSLLGAYAVSSILLLSYVTLGFLSFNHFAG